MKAPGVRVVISLACVVVIVAGLKVAGALLVPIVLGLFLAFVSLPLTRALQRYRVPSVMAVALTVVIDMLIVGSIIFITISLIPDFQKEVPGYVSRLQAVGLEWMASLEERAHLEGAVEAYRNLFDMSGVIELVRQTEAIQRLTSLISKSFVVMILMIFILTEAGSFKVKIQEIFAADGPNLARFQHSTQEIQKYLGIKTMICLVTGLLAGLLTWAFGLKFFIVWGLVAFVFNYIPVIGSILAAIPAVFVALVQPEVGGPLPALGVAIGYLLINLILGNFVEPLLLGRRFGLSTIVVLLSVLFWGWLWGPVGMFLSVPLTMMLKVMLDNTEDFRWISVAMGKTRPGSMESLAEREARALEEDDQIVGA
ncbi:MAG: AI-2E family transporter [Verrucomicrobiota bacterium]